MIVLGGWILSYGAYSQPRMFLLDTKRSFGRVMKGEQVKLGFRVKNEGDQPLIFTRAEATCECTSTELPRKPLMPGDTAVIMVNFDTKSAYGLQDRTVQIFANDPATPVSLRFKGNVKRK